MRTSGAATETRLTLATAAVALGMIMVLMGGPAEFMRAAEAMLWGGAEALHQAWVNFRR
jgi:hypothetical protein